MRKISKISLVAAVAVAGLSTANAQPLEEAIKNVEVNGSVVYRYDNFYNKKNTNDGRWADSGKNQYKIGLNLASKVNDYVKFNSRFIVGGEDSGFAGLNSKRNGNADKNVDVTLSHAYFALTAIPNTVVNIGKQGLATPYTVAQQIDGNEQTGTGILALTNIDVVTLGAGYFNQTNLDKSGNRTTAIMNGGEDLYVATAQADLDYVKLEAWYLGAQDTFNSYTLAATGNVELAENAKLDLEARYVNLKLDSKFAGTSKERKNDMFRFAVDGKFDIIQARVAYTKTGKHGGITAADNDAKNTSLNWTVSSNGYADANFWQAKIGADILDNLNFFVQYGDLRSKDVKTVGIGNDSNVKLKETFGQLTYKMSKNLTTYARYGYLTEKAYKGGNGKDDRKQNMGRLQVAYTF